MSRRCTINKATVILITIATVMATLVLTYCVTVGLGVVSMYALNDEYDYQTGKCQGKYFCSKDHSTENKNMGTAKCCARGNNLYTECSYVGLLNLAVIATIMIVVYAVCRLIYIFARLVFNCINGIYTIRTVGRSDYQNIIDDKRVVFTGGDVELADKPVYL